MSNSSGSPFVIATIWNGNRCGCGISQVPRPVDCRLWPVCQLRHGRWLSPRVEVTAIDHGSMFMGPWPPLQNGCLCGHGLWLAAAFTRHSTLDIFPGPNSSIVGQLNGYQTDCSQAIRIRIQIKPKTETECSVNLLELHETFNDSYMYQYVNLGLL